MKNIFTILRTILFLSLFLNFNNLSAQDYEVFCPADVCGADGIFGAADGVYTDSGAMEGGQIVYEGPAGDIKYNIKCVGSVPSGAPFIVYRWEIHALDGTMVYFDSNVQPFTSFPITDANNVWDWENSSYDPQPSSVAALPVELNFFKVENRNEQVRLFWQTATELNNEGFEIQRSTDNRNWESLGFMIGEGTSYETNDYEFIDSKPQNGVNYYRLKQIDYDGRFAFSHIVSQEFAIGSLSIYPNPANGELITLDFPSVDYEDTQVEIYDNLGRIVQQSVLSYGDRQVNIAELPIGIYTVSVKIGSQFFHEQLIKK